MHGHACSSRLSGGHAGSHLCHLQSVSLEWLLLTRRCASEGALARAGLAIPHHSLPLQILHGPISLAVGTAAGAAAGMLTSLPLVWVSSNVRMLAGVMFSELLIFCG